MKGMKYGIDSKGKVVVVLMIDGDSVKVISHDSKFADLSGKDLTLRVGGKVGNVDADGTRTVRLGEVGYPDAVIDTLEQMGVDVVG